MRIHLPKDFVEFTIRDSYLPLPCDKTPTTKRACFNRIKVAPAFPVSRELIRRATWQCQIPPNVEPKCMWSLGKEKMRVLTRRLSKSMIFNKPHAP